MEFSTRFIDVRKSTEQGSLPCDVLPWGKAGAWCVAGKPVEVARLAESRAGQERDDLLWDECAVSDYLRVPLFPYLTGEDPALVVGYCLQIGFVLAAALPSYLSRIRSLTLVIGQPLESVADAGDDTGPRYRFWLGVACSGYKRT